MKKSLLMALLLLVLPGMCTADMDLDETRVIKLELLLYPDMKRTHDMSSWDAVVEEIKAIITHREEDAQWSEKLYKVISGTITKSHDKNIHGRLHIQMGNGRCVKGVCAQDCACLKKYSGMCPCGLEETRCCAE